MHYTIIHILVGDLMTTIIKFHIIIVNSNGFRKSLYLRGSRIAMSENNSIKLKQDVTV